MSSRVSTSLSARARGAFYLCTLLCMHAEQHLGLLKWRSLSPLFGPFHMVQLADEDWCFAPRSTLRLDGLQPAVDALVRGLVPREHCPQFIRYLAHLNSAALLIATFVSFFCPTWLGRLGRRLPAVVAACSMCVLECLFEATRDSNHRWLLPSFCCAALAMDDPLQPVRGVRHLAFTMAACIFGSAAWSKLTGCGASAWPSLQWAAGESLRWVTINSDTYGARLLAAHPCMYAVASGGTIILELAGVALLLTSVRATAHGSPPPQGCV